MKKWLIVHSKDSYNTNENIIGFDYDKANKIQPTDYIIYYFKRDKNIKGGYIKGLYKVAEKPWNKEESWSSKIQIELEPIKILKKEINIRPLLPVLELFKNHQDKNWGSLLQGSNNIRELSEYDFIILESRINEMSFHETVESSIKDDNKNRKQRLNSANKLPKKDSTSVIRYRRNPDVIAEVLIRAKGICEECREKAPFLRASNNSPYLEVHHKIQLSQGGEDTVQNAIAVCPNCHRRLHYGLST